MINIALIGVATGLDLESGGRSSSVALFVDLTTILTMVVFTCECVLKIIAEAYRPQDYFLDPENGGGWVSVVFNPLSANVYPHKKQPTTHY